MRPSSSLAYLRPPKPKPIRSPFTRPTTFKLTVTNRETVKQTDFNHLVHHAIPAGAAGTSSRPAPGIKKEFYFVHFDDRVKFWNLTPGDRVIIADCTKQFRGKIGTVHWIDRSTNRLGLIEPEFWKVEKQVAHPDMPEFTRNEPIEFEYGTVRLMAPGSDEMYYENLREVDHEAVIVPSGGKRQEIHWSRIGTRYSIRRPGRQSEGEEIIPWPVPPTWSINIQDGDRRLELRDAHLRRMEAEWVRESSRRAGEVVAVPAVPASHIQSREVRKDLFTSPLDAWTTTLNPSQYEDTSLWLAGSPSIRARFPDYFSPAHDGPAAVPELAVADWELTAGRHTRRAKTRNWETQLAQKINTQVEMEASKIAGHLALSADVLRPVLKTAYFRPTMLSRPSKKSPTPKEIKIAQQYVKGLLEKVHKRERLAALDLLPALEHFNSSTLAQGDQPDAKS